MDLRNHPTGPLFVQRDGSKVTRKFFDDRLKRIMTYLGIPKGDLTTHSFHRGGAVNLYNLGADLDLVKCKGRRTSNGYKFYLPEGAYSANTRKQDDSSGKESAKNRGRTTTYTNRKWERQRAAVTEAQDDKVALEDVPPINSLAEVRPNQSPNLPQECQPPGKDKIKTPLLTDKQIVREQSSPEFDMLKWQKPRKGNRNKKGNPSGGKKSKALLPGFKKMTVKKLRYEKKLTGSRATGSGLGSIHRLKSILVQSLVVEPTLLTPFKEVSIS